MQDPKSLGRAHVTRVRRFGTTLRMYHKVLLQYYSVIQSITKQCKSLIRPAEYYKVLQSTKKFDSVLQSTTKHYKGFLCTKVPQTTTLYYCVLRSTILVVLRNKKIATSHQRLDLPGKRTSQDHQIVAK